MHRGERDQIIPCPFIFVGIEQAKGRERQIEIIEVHMGHAPRGNALARA